MNIWSLKCGLKSYNVQGIIINKEKILNDSFDIYLTKKFKKMTGVS